MKINSLKLTNFRNHWKSEIKDLGKIVYFIGPNGAGKSSLVDAIQYALTGACRGTSDGGQGSDCLKSEIKGGPKAAAAVTLVTSAGEIMRGVGQGPKSQAHFNIQQVLGLDSRFLRIMAAPMNLLRLERKKQEEVFFALTGGVVGVLEVTKALMTAGVQEAAEIAERVLTPAGREFYLSHLKERRPEIKREIAGLVYAPPDGMAPTDEIKRKRMENEARALESQITSARSSRDQASATRRHLNELYDGRAKRLKEMEQEKSADCRLSSEEIVELKTQLSIHEELTIKRDAIMTRRNTATAKLGEIRSRGERIKNIGPTCPTCEQKLAPEYAKATLDESRAAYKTANDEVAAAQSEMDAVQVKINAINTGDIRENLSRHERADAVFAASKRAYDQAKSELADIEQKLAALPADDGINMVSKDENALGVLRQEIAKLLDSEKETGKMLAINHSRTKLEDELAEVERIIEAVGPGGPVAQLMTAGGVEEVVAMVRENAKKLGVGDVGVTFDPWQITLNGRNIELASGSEEWRVAAAFGIAFAKKAQASIVCLDGADILRGENRDKLTNLVDDSGLEQVFVAGAVDEDRGNFKDVIDGVSVYFVEADEKGVARVERIGVAVPA